MATLLRFHQKVAEPGDALQLKKAPLQARAKATVDAIVEAAARILADEGYDALTVGRIVDVAGVGVGSIYDYFPSKPAIVAEVVRRVTGEIVAEVAAGAAAMGRTTPEIGLRNWLRIIFASVKKRRWLVRAIAQEVPYLTEIDAVRTFSATMLDVARGAPPNMRSLPHVTESSLFLLTVMVRSAVLEAVIERPAHLEEQELEDTLIEIVVALLEQGA